MLLFRPPPLLKHLSLPKSLFSTSTTMSGVFAVQKPAGVTSSQYLVQIQRLLEKIPDFRIRDHREVKLRKRKRLPLVKAGHGGTLDPAADGVMIIAVNDATRSLGKYLECTKTYEAIAHFGASTTSYDREGKVLGYADTACVTPESLEQALDRFRGEIQQIPPIYSALKMNGKPLHEYARDGAELPRSITPRKAIISELITTSEIKYEHDIPTPTVSASDTERLQERFFREAALKGLAEKNDKSALLELENLRREPMPPIPEPTPEELQAKKEEEEASQNSSKKRKRRYDSTESNLDNITTASDSITLLTPPASQKYPIVNLRMTVSSGTYVRSIVHDLAIAMGTKAYTRHLSRVRQGEWVVGKNVILAEEIEKQPVQVWARKALFYMDNGPEGEYVPEDENVPASGGKEESTKEDKEESKESREKEGN